jgi:hypothetical protein
MILLGERYEASIPKNTVKLRVQKSAVIDGGFGAREGWNITVEVVYGCHWMSVHFESLFFSKVKSFTLVCSFTCKQWC